MRHPFDLNLSDLEAIAALGQLSDEEAALVSGGTSSSVLDSFPSISIEFPSNFPFGKKTPNTTPNQPGYDGLKTMTMALIHNGDGTCSDEAGNNLGPCNIPILH